MVRLTAVVLALCLMLSGCGAVGQPVQTQYTATFLELFDTVTTIVGRADSEEAFQAVAQQIRDELEVYHQLFDIYHDYPDVANLKTVNDQAGIAPVVVDGELLALLKDCKEYYALTGGKVNVAMGSVLKLWHDARTEGRNDPANAALPEMSALEAAAEHMDFDAVILDEAASTVYITDPKVQLDVGAIAKGWATQAVAERAPKGLLISVGGNVCATGPKLPDGTAWVVGIQNPDGEGYLHTLYVTGGCVVTSGDYQRSYVVDGVAYHHIIDPESRMPARYWRSVSVVCADSGLADALSTALFLLPLEEGLELAEQCQAQVMWVDSQGEEYFTPGFEDLIRT